MFANTPELMNIGDIDTIIAFEADSFYVPLRHTEQFKEFEKKMLDNYSNLLKEIRYYEKYELLYWEGEIPINGELINLYQNYVRDDINKLKELKSVYKPTYRGIRVPVYIEYETSFKDSVFIADVTMSDQLDSLLEVQTYLNEAIDDLIYDTSKSKGDFIIDAIIEIRGYRNDSIFEPDTSIFIKPKMRK